MIDKLTTSNTQSTKANVDAATERSSEGAIRRETGRPTRGSASSESLKREEEEEEGECGLRLFMKGGDCKDEFTDWEKCVQEAETNNEDLLEKCAEITAALKRCMDAHSDYYEPILRAEKLAEEQAIIELEKEKQDSLAKRAPTPTLF
ncbi:hypothetical protein Fmac_027306 [Flemingia macrophylla]|uniref:GCK domain-containing protein n=1 Tax=Flemingia macrophylla TaxID=520843 RepID=A0ABD1LHD2_9FABA